MLKLPPDFAIECVKILAKLLAMRLITVISNLAHADQSGFMPKRNTALNLRRLQAVISQIPTVDEEAVILIGCQDGVRLHRVGLHAGSPVTHGVWT